MLLSTHAASMPWSVDVFGVVPPSMTLIIAKPIVLRRQSVASVVGSSSILVSGSDVKSEDRTGFSRRVQSEIRVS